MSAHASARPRPIRAQSHAGAALRDGAEESTIAFHGTADAVERARAEIDKRIDAVRRLRT